MDPLSHQGLRRLVLALDAAMIVLALALARGLHALLRPVIPALRDPPSFEQYAVLLYLMLPLFLALLGAFGLHRVFERLWHRAELLFDLAKVHVVLFLLLSVLIVLTGSIINRSLVLAFLASSYALLFVERSVLQRWQRYQHESGQGRRRLLLVGDATDEMRRFVAHSLESSLPPLMMGRLTPGPERFADPSGLPPRLGDLAMLPRVLHAEAVDQVLFFPPLHTPDRVQPSLKSCEELGVPVGFSLGLPQHSDTPARLVTLHELPFVSFEASPKAREALALKHFIDAAAAFVLLLLLSPVMLLIAAAILVTMGRPIFFSQERAGLYGRRFRMLKFRTMVRDAERARDGLLAHNEMSGPVFKVTNDPRVTRLGTLLRRTSLDELPQLFHVLLGSMSLVGPRPLPISEQQRIRGWQRRRLSMKPGITGLWQVSGRNDVDFEDWMRLDLEYVDRWSLSLDLSILARTLPAVLFGKGAR